MVEERQWIQEIIAGNAQAYVHIIDKYKNPLYGMILRMTKNTHDAEDLAQEVFIKVYEQLHKYQRTGSFSSWFYRVAMNHCIDHFRKKRFASTEIEEWLMIEEQHPESIYLKKEKHLVLEKLIATLPKDERLVILLRYRQELSYQEISDITQLSMSTIRNKLHRAKQKMRRTINENRSEKDDLSID